MSLCSVYFIYLFLTVWVIVAMSKHSLIDMKRAVHRLSVTVCGLLVEVDSLVVNSEFQGMWASVVASHGSVVASPLALESTG